jgi:thiol:disulfide interchange protein DsbD
VIVFRIKGSINYYTLQGDQVETNSEPFSKQFIYQEPATQNPPQEGNRSLIGWLIAGLIAGLIGFLTPCVYSLVPVTVSLFLKRSKTPEQGRKSALFYSFSIVLIYTIVGILSCSICTTGYLEYHFHQLGL